MKIDKHVPVPPPMFTMTFTRDEGWAITAALFAYADHHPVAADAMTWREWASELDKKLRP